MKKYVYFVFLQHHSFMVCDEYGHRYDLEDNSKILEVFDNRESANRYAEDYALSLCKELRIDYNFNNRYGYNKWKYRYGGIIENDKLLEEPLFRFSTNRNLLRNSREYHIFIEVQKMEIQTIKW